MMKAESLKIGYDQRIVVGNVSFEIKKGEIVSLIGPNGSGKSTILKVLSRLMKAESGHVTFNEESIAQMNTKLLAKRLAILPQSHVTPPDFTVKELVAYGRSPHKKWYEALNDEDEHVIEWALEQTNLLKFKNRYVGQLSGGERQRAWIAATLAQKPELLLLDEPTTYLDICHQIEVMELVKRLNETLGLTVVMVLHDLNQAARYSDRLMVLKAGKLVGQGKPETIMTTELLESVYHVKARVAIDTDTNKPIFTPLGLVPIICEED